MTDFRQGFLTNFLLSLRVCFILFLISIFVLNLMFGGGTYLLKGERKLLKRVCELPSDLASAYLDDLKATAEERLAFFERIAKK